MFISQMDFYMTVSSSDCSQLFPDNKPEDFRVNIEDPLIFASLANTRWCVGLCDISYPSMHKSGPSLDDIAVFSDICQETWLHSSQQPVLRYINGGGSLRKCRGMTCQTYNTGL
jgi:hypothetical protein